MGLIRALSVIEWSISFLCILYAIYYVLTTLFFLKKRHKHPEQAARIRFLAVIAARNEEAVIGNLVDSLFQQNYPRALFDVLVIPNNYTDRTRDVALASGARIMDIHQPVKSKGEVLAQVFDLLLKEDLYDAYCIFDADNLVHPEFLKAMNDAVCSGASVAQGYRDSKNPHDTIVSASYAIYYWMISRLYNHSRNQIGLSATINGSGFMVTAAWLQKMGGWRTNSLTEDLEVTIQTVLAGGRVDWVPEAIIYDEQPLTFGESWKQRKRWSTGQLQVTQGYLKRFLHGTSAGHRWVYLDQVLFLLAPFFQLFYGVSNILVVILNLLNARQHIIPAIDIVMAVFVSISFSYLSTVAASLTITLLEKKFSLKMIKGMLFYWVFITSWIPINILCLFKKQTLWEQIKHTRSIQLKDITGKAIDSKQRKQTEKQLPDDHELG